MLVDKTNFGLLHGPQMLVDKTNFGLLHGPPMLVDKTILFIARPAIGG